MNCGKI